MHCDHELHSNNLYMYIMVLHMLLNYAYLQCPGYIYIFVV